MVKCRKNWCYFSIQKVSKVGGIHIPTVSQQEKEEATIISVGPDVKGVKEKDNVVMAWKDVVKYDDIDAIDKSEIRGFVKEDDIIAIVKNSKPELN